MPRGEVRCLSSAYACEAKTLWRENPPSPRSEFWNEKIETLPREELRKLQWRRLKAQIIYAYENTAYYHSLFRELGLKPDDIRSIEDFQKKIPLIRKDDIRGNATPEDPFAGLLAVPQRLLSRVFVSTGTTGLPTLIPLTKWDERVAAEQYARAWWMIGARPGDRVIIAGLWWHAWLYGLDKGARRAGLINIRLSGVGTRHDAERNLKIMKRCRPRGAFILTKQFQEMTKMILEGEEEAPQLEYLATAGDYMVKATYEYYVKAWGTPNIYDQSGLGDLIAVSSQCSAHHGLHFWEDIFFVEVVDPETGEPVEEGEPGNLVLTPLWAKATPYLRWDVEDVVRAWFDRCECGRSHVRVEYLARRSWVVKVRGKEIYVREVEDTLYSIPELLLAPYQLVKKKGVDDLDELVVRVVTSAPDQVLEEAAELLSKRLGVPAKLVRIDASHVRAMPHKWVKVHVEE